MKKVLHDALKRAIKNWQRRVRGELVLDRCPLCEICDSECFLHGTNTPCPVLQETGLPVCKNTPWVEWNGSDREVAQKEVEFLESLLPVETIGNIEKIVPKVEKKKKAKRRK